MDDRDFAVDALGWVGVILYIIAYYLVSIGRVHGRSKPYQTMNLVGAFGVAANAFYYHAYPSAVVNVVWFGIAGAMLLGVLRANPEGDPGHPETPETKGVHRALFFLGGLLALFGLALAILAIFPRPTKPAQPIRVHTGEWPPYVSGSRPDHGPVGHLVRDIFRRAGYRPELVFTSWSRAQSALDDGTAIAAFPFIATTDRSTRFHITDPFLSFDYTLFYRHQGTVTEEALRAWNPETAPPAPGWRLGVVEGYQLWSSLGQAIEPTHTFDHTAAAFEALASGEIDLVAESRLVGQRVLADPTVPVDASLVATAPGALTTSEQQLHILTPRTTAGLRLVEKLNHAIASLRNEGRLAETRDQLSTPPSTDTPPSTVIVTDVTVARDAEGNTFRLPRGTRGVVLAWPPAFIRPLDQATPAQKSTSTTCKLKLINGPLRGRILTVGVASIEILTQKQSP